jgi:hypothetical protein
MMVANIKTGRPVNEATDANAIFDAAHAAGGAHAAERPTTVAAWQTLLNLLQWCQVLVLRPRRTRLVGDGIAFRKDGEAGFAGVGPPRIHVGHDANHRDSKVSALMRTGIICDPQRSAIRRIPGIRSIANGYIGGGGMSFCETNAHMLDQVYRRHDKDLVVLVVSTNGNDRIPEHFCVTQAWHGATPGVPAKPHPFIGGATPDAARPQDIGALIRHVLGDQVEIPGSLSVLLGLAPPGDGQVIAPAISRGYHAIERPISANDVRTVHVEGLGMDGPIDVSGIRTAREMTTSSMSMHDDDLRAQLKPSGAAR